MMDDAERKLSELIGEIAGVDDSDGKRRRLFALLLSAASAVYVQSARDPWEDPKEAEDLIADMARESLRNVLRVAKQQRRDRNVA